MDLHDEIGRRLEANGGSMPYALLFDLGKDDVTTALDDMGLNVTKGMVYRTKQFNTGWNALENKWAPQPVQLYRFYDSDGALLYVGVSGRMSERMKQHRGAASWFELAHRVDMVHYPSRGAALRAETEAIKNEHPKYNVVHNKPMEPCTKCGGVVVRQCQGCGHVEG